ncbi:MAG: sortase [Candidatus Shapirobacteria bacterium]|jgi:LPXTG-site transpeptidase (sortase) family protein
MIVSSKPKTAKKISNLIILSCSFFFCYLIFTFYSAKFNLKASEYFESASDFVQWCNEHNDICQKTDVSGRTGSATCPLSSQTVDKVYVHAGSGQDIWLLPDEKFTYTISGNTATVTVVTGHDLSWIAVYCENSCDCLTCPPCNPTITPAPTSTPTATPSPTITPTKINTPTPTSISSPTPTPTQFNSPTPTATCSPTPTQTPISSPTPTAILSFTPTPSPTFTPTPTPTSTLNPTETPSPSPTSTPVPGPTETPGPGPTETPVPGPTSTPGPANTPTPFGVGGGEEYNPLVAGVTRSTTTETADNYNPLIEGIQDSYIGEVLGMAFPATAETQKSLAKLPSNNLLLPDHFIVIPKIGLNRPVYQGEIVGGQYLAGHQEVITSVINGSPVYYAHSWNAALFEGISRMAIGDFVYVDIAGAGKAYQVSAKSVVADTDLTAIRPSTSDTIYLLTCVDATHRLLFEAKKLP